MTKRAGVAPSGGTAARGPDESSGAVSDPGDLATPTDALGELRAVLERDKLAWRRFVKRYDRPLREVVRHASEAIMPLSDEHVDDVLGDFWLRVISDDIRLLRAFNPARGASLFSWLTFHVSRETTEYIRRIEKEPKMVPLEEAQHMAAPRTGRAPRLRNETAPATTFDELIRSALRDVVATELRQVIGNKSLAHENEREQEGFISIDRAAEIADTHPATIRSWIRSGQLEAGKTGRHYKVRRSDVIAFVSNGKRDLSTVNIQRLAADIIAGDRDK